MTLKFARFGAVAAAALFVALSGTGAMAQDRHYATGAATTPLDQKRSIPQAPVFRDFLPQAVDLSRYMPPVGDQANQGSCVGWATAYAARAYYAEQIEHRDIKLPQNVPSPAWLFDIIHIGNDCDGGAIIPDAMKVLMSGAANAVAGGSGKNDALSRPRAADLDRVFLVGPRDLEVTGARRAIMVRAPAPSAKQISVSSFRR